jgi:hypothetical protein
MNHLDYVELYATALKNNNKLFKQQKILIDSQLQSSSSIFRNMFGTGYEFKRKAREYLKRIGLLKSP